MREGMQTPWGRAETVDHLAEGLWKVDTPGHGGIKCGQRRNAAVQRWLADNDLTEIGYGGSDGRYDDGRYEEGWYDEDGPVTAVMATFPEAFNGPESPYDLRGKSDEEVRGDALDSLEFEKLHIHDDTDTYLLAAQARGRERNALPAEPAQDTEQATGVDKAGYAALENAQVESVSVEAPTAKQDDFLAGQDTAIDRLLTQEAPPLPEAGQSQGRARSR
jgi:hypothetical protein